MIDIGEWSICGGGQLEGLCVYIQSCVKIQRSQYTCMQPLFGYRADMILNVARK